MKILLTLSLTIVSAATLAAPTLTILNKSALSAQAVEPEALNLDGKSCSERMRLIHDAPSAIDGAEIVTPALLSSMVLSFGMISLAPFGITAGTLIGVAFVGGAHEVHYKNILAVFEGAESGGNSKTEKIWRIANKRHKNVFKNMTYQEFLDAIHDANVSGLACREEAIPERKDILRILVSHKELNVK